MNREETKHLLNVLAQAYPMAATKFGDKKLVVDLWTTVLGEYEIKDTLRAARLHIEVSSFFPTIHDILSQIPRAQMLNRREEAPAIDAGEVSDDSSDLESDPDYLFMVRYFEEVGA